MGNISLSIPRNQGEYKMDFFEVVIRNKRYKNFNKDQIRLNTDEIKQLIACAQLAPTISENQNYTFIIIDDSKIKQDLIELVSNAEWLINASIILAVVVVTVSETSEDLDDTNIIDAIVASAQLMMGATANHLGCDLIVEFNQEGIKSLLNIIDERLEVIALIPIGKTEGEGSKGYKRSLSELSHYNSLGNPYPYD